MPGCVLLIAYHFPPFAGSSGLQRTLSFCRHLREHEWRPVVLSVQPAAYESTTPAQLADIPSDVPVVRTRALDAARDLAVGGRYWGRLALPDRWSSWWLSAVPSGLRLIHKHEVDVVWATYPIATALRIGATLGRISGRPWIADFRDPMVEEIQGTGEVFPSDPLLRSARLAIEGRAAETAARLVFCTNSARDIVVGRYPAISSERMAVIPNGYDEDAFRDAEVLAGSLVRPPRRVLLHSGLIYRSLDRDPTALFQALRSLADEQVVSADDFELRLRDPANEQYFRELAVQHGIEGLVTIAPALPYREALAEMIAADGLLLLQGITSNPAVPAKLYEYLRAGRPVIALVHPDGETAKVLRSVGAGPGAPLDEPGAIRGLLCRWLAEPMASRRASYDATVIAEYSRRQQARRLAEQLDEVSARRSTGVGSRVRPRRA